MRVVDSLTIWAEQDHHPGVRIWRRGRAIAVASPDLSGRDRLAVSGPIDEVVGLVRTALAEVGPTYRPIGAADLIGGLLDRLPELEPVERGFGWMETTDAPTPPAADGPVRCEWLTEDDDEAVAAILDAAFPTSYARPGRPGVHRWAGVRGESGSVLAVAAEAWSAPSVGLVSGIASLPTARGRGLAEAACRFLLRAVIEDRGRAALMVDRQNTAAIRLYQKLGMAWRDVAAARVRG